MDATRFSLLLVLTGLVAAPPPARAGDAPRVRFEDAAGRAGLTLISVSGDVAKSHILESTGSGVAVADYDGDGDEDLYVATGQTTTEWLAGARTRANALYRNDGDGSFTDVAAEAGVALRAWSTGAYFADVDNDGDKDLFVTAWGANTLYRNEGNGRFVDATSAAGLAGEAGEWGTSAAFADLDGDGDLDLYVANYCEYDLADPPFGGGRMTWKGVSVFRGPRTLVAQRDRLYRNDGGGKFSDVSAAAGIGRAAPSYGLGVVVKDLDGDGDQDIYVANDSLPNHLWRNEGGLRFVEVGARAGVATNEDAYPQAGMGTDSADYDGDGRPDLFVTNFSHDFNTLYRNAGNLIFTDQTFRGKLSDSYLSLGWGIKFADLDNDGRLDLIYANGHTYPEVDAHASLNSRYEQANTLYLNDGDGTFVHATATAGPGLQVIASTRGLAVWDYERDGDLDVVLTNLDAAPTLLRNEGNGGDAWLSLRLQGVRANRDAVGARVELTAGGRMQVRWVDPFGSYLSQSSYRVHFGLGTAGKIDSVVVHWPGGEAQALAGLRPGRAYVVVEGEKPRAVGGKAP